MASSSSSSADVSNGYTPEVPADPFAPPSRRSPVLATRGMVASSQPLASEAGLRILREGGNAADAAVTMAAALAVTEPCSTGLGGDAFVLFYSSSCRSVHCIQGNGRCPASLSLSSLAERGFSHAPFRPLPPTHALNVTVPGAAAAWCDTIESFGSKPLSRVLQPAIELADGGWPVPLLTAAFWRRCEQQLLQGGPHGGDLLAGDGTRAPRAGEVMRNAGMAATLRSLAENGRQGFYSGRIAEAIVAAVSAKGGALSLSDLASHTSTFNAPIATTYRGVTVWEVPPPTAGAAALMALNIVEAKGELREVPRGSTDHQHLLIEAMRLGFADALTYVGDSAHVKVPLDVLLSKEYARKRAASVTMERAAEVLPGDVACSLAAGSDTVYFCAVDGEGNACSMINSNYMGFGTGIVPEGCGFSLQNRGHNFSLDPTHPNCLAPGKRPYHTIIPGLATWAPEPPPASSNATGQAEETAGAAGPGSAAASSPVDGGEPAGELFCAFGNMGGFMQPQGHLQLVTNLVDYHLDPQAAIDAPRFCLMGFPCATRGHGAHPVRSSHVALEDRPGVAELAEELRRRGHLVEVVRGYERELYGKAQVIVRDRRSGVLWGGSEGRADGCALGF